MNGGGTNSEGIIGQKVTLKPNAGESILLKNNATSNASTAGNLILGSDVTVTDTQVITLRYQEDVTFTDSVGGWLIESSTSATSSGGVLPAGTAENDHLEWDNTGLQWVASTTINVGDPGVNPIATTGKINLQNSGFIAYRDGLNAEDLTFGFDSNQNWFMDGLTVGGSALDLNNNFVIMDELPALGVPTGSANQVKIYAKEDTDTITRLFYKDSANVENSITGGATQQLDNLADPIAINKSLLPDVDSTRNIGSDALHFRFAFLQAIDFESDKTPSSVGTTKNTLGADSLGLWANIGSTTDFFSIYEVGTEIFRFGTPSSNVYEIFIGPQTFTSGEKYSIQFGEALNSRADIFFIEGTGNDLILNRDGGGVNQGVQVRVDGISAQRWLSVETKFFKTLNINAKDIFNVVDIKSNGGGGATTGTIGELITSDGGFNYFMRDTLAWESDPDTKLTFGSGGITLETDGSNNDIDIIASGSSSDIGIAADDNITITATDNITLTSGDILTVINDNTFYFSDGIIIDRLTVAHPVIKPLSSSRKLGMQVNSTAIAIGSEGTIQIPHSTSSTTSSATLDGLFGNANGCIGLGNSTSANPSLWVKSSGTWRRAFLS